MLGSGEWVPLEFVENYIKDGEKYFLYITSTPIIWIRCIPVEVHCIIMELDVQCPLPHSFNNYFFHNGYLQFSPPLPCISYPPPPSPPRIIFTSLSPDYYTHPSTTGSPSSRSPFPTPSNTITVIFIRKCYTQIS